MPVHYNDDLKSARMEAVIDEVDGHASFATIEIGNGNPLAVPPTLGTLLCTITLQKPSFTENNAVITMAAPAGGLSGTAVAAGTASSAQIKKGDGTVVVNGLAVSNQAGSGEIKLNSVTISQDQTVTISSGTISHAS